MASANLGIVPVTQNQNNKEITINNADLAVELATQLTLPVDMSGGDVTLTNTAYTRNFIFKCSGQLANQNLVVPLALTVGNPCQRVFAVLNKSVTYNVVVTGLSGLTVTLTPGGGAMIYSDGTDLNVLFNFTTGGSPVDLGGLWRGVLTNACIVLAYKFARNVTVAVNAALSQASCLTNPTATATLLIKKNGATIGTLVFSTGGVPTWTLAGGASFVPGDELTIIGPASADATLADVDVTVGLR